MKQTTAGSKIRGRIYYQCTVDTNIEELLRWRNERGWPLGKYTRRLTAAAPPVMRPTSPEIQLNAAIC
jgi:hypothetical protein